MVRREWQVPFAAQRQQEKFAVHKNFEAARARSLSSSLSNAACVK